MSAEFPAPVLLDTHAVLWWQGDTAELSAKARRAIDEASARLVSPVTFWEITMLIEKGRVALDRSTAAWVNDFLAGDRIGIAELTPAAAVAAGELADFHGDPADRMIVASALATGSALITKDRKIRDWAKTSKKLQVVW
jgi:PIN domain nuclease of toxin-antitoxin system